MVKLSAERIWSLSDKELLNVLDSTVLVPQSRRVHFYTPSFIPYSTKYYSNATNKCFPTISVTGSNCALNCKHCEGVVLQTMYTATTPEKLYRLCVELKQKGALGCLISGGCQPNGSVPLERFIPAIKKAKLGLDMTVLVHTGIIKAEMAKQLKAVAVDAVLIDVIGSNETIYQIYNLGITTSDYKNSLATLQNSRLDFVPHVIVGLHNGELRGELEALNMIAQHKPQAVAIIAFMPIHGTSMAKIAPPKPIDIARTVAVARVLMPNTPLALGCMRPKGKHRQETDILALKAGINAIAYPTETAIEYTQGNGYQIVFSPVCCAQIHKDTA